MDFLAFSGTGSARSYIEGRNDPASGSVCRLDRPRRLPCSGGWLHCQDEVKQCYGWSASSYALKTAATAFVSPRDICINADIANYLFDFATRSTTRAQF